MRFCITDCRADSGSQGKFTYKKGTGRRESHPYLKKKNKPPSADPENLCLMSQGHTCPIVVDTRERAEAGTYTEGTSGNIRNLFGTKLWD